MDYKTRQELVVKLDEADNVIREGIKSFDISLANRDSLTKVRNLLQGCITEILSMK